MKLQNYVIGILAVLLGPLLSPVSANVCMLTFYETDGETSKRVLTHEVEIAKGKNCKTELGTMTALSRACMEFVESEESDDNTRLSQLASLDAVPLDLPHHEANVVGYKVRNRVQFTVGDLEQPDNLTLFNSKGKKTFELQFPKGEKKQFEEQWENMSHTGELAASFTMHFPFGDDVYDFVANAYFEPYEGRGTSLQNGYGMSVDDGQAATAPINKEKLHTTVYDMQKFLRFRGDIWPRLKEMTPTAFHMAITKPVIDGSMDVVSVVDMIGSKTCLKAWQKLVSFFDGIGTFHVDTANDFVMLFVEVINFNAGLFPPQIEEETFDTAPMQNKNAHRRQTRKFRRKRRAHLRHVRRGRQAKRRTNPQEA